MRTVGAVFRARGQSGDATTARLLADSLLAEILEKAYQDPDATPVFGVESGETSRALYDDVDDYAGLSETPPKFRDGVSMSHLTGWARNVTVQQIATTDALMTATITVGGTPVGVGMRSGASGATGVRRITVNVRRNGTLLATAVGIRAESAR